MKIWNDVKDCYFLQLLKMGLNNIPMCSKNFEDMSEQEFVEWLGKQDLDEQKKIKGKFAVQVPEMVEPGNTNKSDVVILPLSLEDNSTIASIFEEFGKEFSISCDHDTCFLPFNENDSDYDDGGNVESAEPASKSKKNMFHELDSKFGKTYDYVEKKMWKAVHNSDSSAFEQFLHEMDEKRCEWDILLQTTLAEQLCMLPWNTTMKHW